MKKIVYIPLFVFVSSCFHQEIYSCSAPKQLTIFIEIKNNKFYSTLSTTNLKTESKIHINNKMEVYATESWPYSRSVYLLNKIEKKLEITEYKRGRYQEKRNYKCTKK
tara:strand:+ start:81 stop:404 length:324 start_codon:yes stop_codon:yes gene_type:complete